MSHDKDYSAVDRAFKVMRHTVRFTFENEAIVFGVDYSAASFLVNRAFFKIEFKAIVSHAYCFRMAHKCSVLADYAGK